MIQVLSLNKKEGEFLHQRPVIESIPFKKPLV